MTESSPASPPKPGPARRSFALTPLHIVVAGFVLLVVAVMLMTYFGQVRPQAEFKRALNAAFESAQKFDRDTPQDHAAVIDRWQRFEQTWQSQVAVQHPEFISVINAAQAQRSARELLTTSAEDRQRQETIRRRKTYLNQAREAFESSRTKAAAATRHDAAIQAWDEFIAKYDVKSEGLRPPELAAWLAEASTARQARQKALDEEKKQVADYVAERGAALAKLREIIASPDLTIAAKINSAETFIADFAGAPVTATGDPQVLDIKNAADGLLVLLRAKAVEETPASPLTLAALFADSPCKDFSENGRKHLLLEAQTLLKTLDFYQGIPDGAPSLATHEAILAFQKSQNLVPSAALDTRTLATLEMSELKDDPTPFTSHETAKNSRKPRPKAKGEDKDFFDRMGEGAKKVGQSIGNLFRGKN